MSGDQSWKQRIRLRTQASFAEELTLLDIHIQLDQSQQSNPQDNYEILSKLIMYVSEKHFTNGKVKYK